jgi:hypothetical protein
LNFKPVPFAILVVIGVFLIPIQTSTEEYVLEGISCRDLESDEE